jgi:DNA polymerase III subunit gamma/tau
MLEEFSKLRSSPTEKIVYDSDFNIENTLLTFKLTNKIQHDIFYEIKQELLNFLRKKLENSEIQVEAIITSIESKAKPRTEQEKFEAMAKKNPEIIKLKEELGLDLLF